MIHWAALASVLIVQAASGRCMLPEEQLSPPGTPVSISGDVTTPLTIDAHDAGGFPVARAHFRLSPPHPKNGGDVRTKIDGEFEGVYVSDLLAKAGAVGKAAKSGLADSSILARAALDKTTPGASPYEVTFSYSEIDPKLNKHPAILAFRCNGFPITPTLLAPDDTTGTRYVHEVLSLTFEVPK